MSRTTAREIALHMIYELGFEQKDATELLSERLEAEQFDSLLGEYKAYSKPPSDKELHYIQTLVKGVFEHDYELATYLEKYSVSWTVARISRVCSAVMKIAMYELLYMPEIPESVSINEAIELAKKYESPEAGAFINGVLGTFVKKELTQ